MISPSAATPPSEQAPRAGLRRWGRRGAFWGLLTLPIWSALGTLGLVCGVQALLLVTAVFGLSAMALIVVFVATGFPHLAAEMLSYEDADDAQHYY